ncbi:MAG: DUF1501 domain-containing protein [Pirellulaceae bacterium]|nr:DUF1501 domain-containing protein [Pirellulaceae bacterium]MDP7019995.1 DUF1501 domain-containing protein [Pirellulaceae bacterium]
MLRIEGPRKRLCDGVNRRQFIEVGALSAFGISLPGVLRAALDSRGKVDSHRSVILIWQHGGPSQLDTFDMKPDAPSEIRGPYQQINSSLPGLPICELMPYHAKVMDKTTVIRSYSHGNGDHWAAAHWMLTGRIGANGSDRVPRDPSMGAVASYLLGARKSGVPSTVNINDGGFGFHGAAYLGVNHNPFRVGEFSYGNEAGRLPSGSDRSFKMTDGLTADRLTDRVSLLKQFDRIRQDADRATFDSFDDINLRAQEMLLSGRAREAFDLSKEDQKTREWYGPGWGEQALLARRLVEAGVRFVSLNTGYFDDHGNIKGALDDKLVRHDRATGVLIQDLANRGMLDDDVLVVTAGEFGRTPKINKNAGRDHWPQAQSILFAGGGYRHGQVIGSTNDKAEHPTSDPVAPVDFCAIIYHALGLKPDHLILDLSNRPTHLLPGGKVPQQML